MCSLADNIAFTLMGLERSKMKLEAFSAATEPHDCCPACRFGDAFTKSFDKVQRQGAWLGVMLRKVGCEGAAEELAREMRLL